MGRMNRKTNSASARLKQDYLRLKKDPVPYVLAEPVPSNILEWWVLIVQSLSKWLIILIMSYTDILSLSGIMW